MSATTSITDRHVDPMVADSQESPQFRCAAVAQQSALLAGQDRGHPLAFLSEADVPDGVNARTDDVEISRTDPAVDLMLCHAHLEQLPP
jgi:hypothetical protein